MFQIQSYSEPRSYRVGGWSVCRNNKGPMEYDTLHNARATYATEARPLNPANSNFRILDLETLTVHPVVEEKHPFDYARRLEESWHLWVELSRKMVSELEKESKAQLFPVIVPSPVPEHPERRKEDSERESKIRECFKDFMAVCDAGKWNPSGFGEDYWKAQREINRMNSLRAESFKIAGNPQHRRKDAGKRAWFKEIYDREVEFTNAYYDKSDARAMLKGFKVGLRAALNYEKGHK